VVEWWWSVLIVPLRSVACFVSGSFSVVVSLSPTGVSCQLPFGDLQA